jgi:hypothetical protein
MRGSIRHIFLLVFAALAGAGGVLGQSDKVPPAQDQVLGTPADLESDEPAFLWLERGMSIFASPDSGARAIAMVDIRLRVPITQHRGPWIQIRYAGSEGWVLFGDEEPAQEREPEPLKLDQRLLGYARTLLGTGSEPPTRLGSFDLYTDVDDGELLDFLNGIAAQLPAVYETRYGLETKIATEEALVIFSRQQEYVYFARAADDQKADRTGHSPRGLAVLYAGEQSREEIAAVLIHELTHLLTRRVLGDSPPPWLTEGMSNDLAFCSLGRFGMLGKLASPNGRIRVGTLGGHSVVIGNRTKLSDGDESGDARIRLSGAKAATKVVRDSEEVLPLDTLEALPPREFMHPDGLDFRHHQSALLVRFLLDGEEGRLSHGFRAFLQSLAGEARGGHSAALTPHLRVGWDELTHGFADWLGRE